MIAAVRKVRTWLVASLLFLCLSAGVAAGTLSGASGLMTLGTADSLPQGTGEFSLRFVDGRVVGSAAYGILGDVEIGVNTYRSSAEPLGVGVFIKGLIMRETSSAPGLSIGLESDQSYVVISKRVAPRLRLHGSALYGDMQGFAVGAAYNLSTASVTGSAFSPSATTLLAELTPAGVNVGARVLFGPSMQLEVGLLDLKEITAGVSMRIGF